MGNGSKERNTAEKAVGDVLEKLKELGAKELLSYAIFNEEEEAKYYSELAELTGRTSVRALFIKMSEDSKDHEMALRRLFEKLFPGETPVRVEIPPIEAAPFVPVLRGIEDYTEALRYCMESELLAKRVYQRLAEIVEDDETRELAIVLASMEQEHYEELMRVYELLRDLEAKRIQPRELEPGGYLFTDNKKAKYFLLDFLGWDRVLFALVREMPDEFMKMFSGRYSDVLWISKVESEEFKRVIRPEGVLELKKKLAGFLRESRKKGKSGVIFIENIGYLAIETDPSKLFDMLFYLRDVAVLKGGYVIVTAIREAFERREWAILTSEFEVIS